MGDDITEMHQIIVRALPILTRRVEDANENARRREKIENKRIKKSLKYCRLTPAGGFVNKQRSIFAKARPIVIGLVIGFVVQDQLADVQPAAEPTPAVSHSSDPQLAEVPMTKEEMLCELNPRLSDDEVQYLAGRMSFGDILVLKHTLESKP